MQIRLFAYLAFIEYNICNEFSLALKWTDLKMFKKSAVQLNFQKTKLQTQSNCSSARDICMAMLLMVRNCSRLKRASSKPFQNLEKSNAQTVVRPIKQVTKTTHVHIVEVRSFCSNLLVQIKKNDKINSRRILWESLE